MSMLKDDKINYLNIGLMFATAVFAFFAPFETFLLAYAFLGPLHYLTEISWLHDRQYFTKGKYDFIVLLIIGVLLSTVAFAQDFGYKWEIYTYFSEMQLSSKLVVFALFSGMLFALVKNIFVKIVSCFFIFIFVSGWLSPENLEENQSSTTVFALTSLVPTLIHVYVFTGLFMLYGSLKSRSKSGLMAVVAVVILPLILVFVLPVNPKESWVSSYGKNAYYAKGQGFFNTNVEIMDHFGILDEPKLTNKQFLDSIVNSKTANAGFTPNEKKRLNDSLQRKSKEPFVFYQPNDERFGQTIAVRKALPVNPKDYFWNSVFFSTFGIMLMRFIAFAYLYHYLNWFSKTEVIRWHKVPKIRFFAVIVLWLSACGFYIYDYSLGLSVLFFLSFTHVLLEFPLNMVSIVGIGKEVRSIYRNGFKPLNSDT
ncbi:MAG: hypothetical protein ACO28O_01685 [Crocinitomicaceae bacterium]|jgi:hypothetical protein